MDVVDECLVRAGITLPLLGKHTHVLLLLFILVYYSKRRYQHSFTLIIIVLSFCAPQKALDVYQTLSSFEGGVWK